MKACHQIESCRILVQIFLIQELSFDEIGGRLAIGRDHPGPCSHLWIYLAMSLRQCLPLQQFAMPCTALQCFAMPSLQPFAMPRNGLDAVWMGSGCSLVPKEIKVRELSFDKIGGRLAIGKDHIGRHLMSLLLPLEIPGNAFKAMPSFAIVCNALQCLPLQQFAMPRNTLTPHLNFCLFLLLL